MPGLLPDSADSQYANLHPEFTPRVQQLQAILRDKYGLNTTVGEGYRSPQRQNQLYAQGRTTRGPIVTGARGGSSYHNYGAAVDLRPTNMDEDKAGRVVGQAFKDNPGLGLTWGGTFSNLYDPLHVQLGVPLAQLRNNNVQVPTQYAGASGVPVSGTPDSSGPLSPENVARQQAFAPLTAAQQSGQGQGQQGNALSMAMLAQNLMAPPQFQPMQPMPNLLPPMMPRPQVDYSGLQALLRNQGTV